MFCHLENLVVLNALDWHSDFIGFRQGISGLNEVSIVWFLAEILLLREPAALSRTSTSDQDLFSA